MSAIYSIMVLVYALILSLVAGYLAIRGVQTRMYGVFYLVAAYCSKLIVQLIEPLEYRHVLRGIFDFNDVPFILAFTKQVYHQRQHVHFRVMLTIVLIFRVLVGALVIAYRFDIPTSRALTGVELVMYYIYMGLGAIATWIAYGSLVSSAVKAIALKRGERAHLAWFRFRNTWIAAGFSMFLAVPFIWFLFPVDGTMFNIDLIPGTPWPPAAILGLIIVFPIYSALAFNAVAWLPPPFITKRFDGGKTSRNLMLREIIDASSQDTVLERPDLQKILHQRGTLEILNYLGDHLATQIGKQATAVKGLLLLSIISQLGNDATYIMNLNQLLLVVNNALKSKLQTLGIDNVDEVIARLQEKIIREQSMLVMMGI